VPTFAEGADQMAIHSRVVLAVCLLFAGAPSKSPLLAADPPLAPQPTRVCVLPHEEFIDAVVFSPDGKLLATSAGDRRRFFETYEVRVFDTAKGELVWEFKSRSKVTELAFSPAGDKLMFGAYDGKIVDAKSGRALCRLEQEGRAFSAEGDQVIGPGTGGLAISDAATGRLLKSVLPELKRTPTHFISSFSRSPDGKRFVVMQDVGDERGDYRNVYLVDWNGFKITAIRRKDYDVGGDAIWLNSREVLLRHVGRPEAVLYDADRGESRVVPCSCGLFPARVSEDSIAMLGGLDGGGVGVEVFDIRKNRLLARWTVARDHAFGGLTLSDDGKLMAVSGDRNVTIWKIDEAPAESR
jgi:WD40 repeat protein